jgi:hypothetical protein
MNKLSLFLIFIHEYQSYPCNSPSAKSTRDAVVCYIWEGLVLPLERSRHQLQCWHCGDYNTLKTAVERKRVKRLPFSWDSSFSPLLAIFLPPKLYVEIYVCWRDSPSRQQIITIVARNNTHLIRTHFHDWYVDTARGWKETGDTCLFFKTKTAFLVRADFLVIGAAPRHCSVRGTP